jgi:hypothetical protein
MGRHPCGAVHLQTCYRQQCDKSIFQTYYNTTSFFSDLPTLLPKEAHYLPTNSVEEPFS